LDEKFRGGRNFVSLLLGIDIDIDLLLGIDIEDKDIDINIDIDIDSSRQVGALRLSIHTHTVQARSPWSSAARRQHFDGVAGSRCQWPNGFLLMKGAAALNICAASGSDNLVAVFRGLLFASVGACILVAARGDSV
jgi:hypothetical protein